MDETGRTIMMLWTRAPSPDFRYYEMITVAEDGLAKNRTWHLYDKGRLFQRTIINEVYASADWQAHAEAETCLFRRSYRLRRRHSVLADAPFPHLGGYAAGWPNGGAQCLRPANLWPSHRNAPSAMGHYRCGNIAGDLQAIEKVSALLPRPFHHATLSGFRS